MNRVICCYPDMPKLAGAAAVRANGMLGMSFPNYRWWTRLGLSIVNLAFRVIRMRFRVFLHPPPRILAAVEQRGFQNRRYQPWRTLHGFAAGQTPRRAYEFAVGAT